MSQNETEYTRARNELIEFLSEHPQLQEREARDAWLSMSLPPSVYQSLAKRHDHCKTDLALIFDATKNMQLEDGRWAILALIESMAPSLVGVTLGGRNLEEVCKPIEDILLKTNDRVLPRPTSEQRAYKAISTTSLPKADAETISPKSILIVATTKVEIQAIFEVFCREPPEAATWHIIRNATYYPLGIHGGIPVYVVQCEMGIATPGGALTTVKQAIEDLDPQAVIMCGIAFGLRPDKQQLGDILIAKQLQYYEIQKIDARAGRLQRGDRVTASERLLNRCRSGDNDWHGPGIHFGLIMSGEKLVNDATFRDMLLTEEPEAIGGEMEGAGVYTAARAAKVDWILIKAVCDWADGSKNDESQDMAAHNAAAFVKHVLELGNWTEPVAIGSPREEVDIELRKSVPARPIPEFSWELLGGIDPEHVPIVQREDVIDKIKTVLGASSEEHVVFLYGPPKVGKTFVLTRLQDDMKEQYIPLFINLNGWASTRSLLDFLEELAEHIQSEIEFLMPEVLVEPFQRVSEAQATAEFSRFIKGLYKSLGPGERKFLFIFDELDYLERFETDGLIFKFFGGFIETYSRSRQARFIFAGSGDIFDLLRRAELAELVASGTKVSVDCFVEEISRSFIRSLTAPYFEFAEEALERVIYLADGHPILLKEILGIIVRYWKNDPRRKVLNNDDVNAALDDIRTELSPKLKDIWLRLTLPEQRVMQRIARSGKEAFESNEVAGEKKDLTKLVNRQILYNFPPKYCVRLGLLVDLVSSGLLS